MTEPGTSLGAEQAAQANPTHRFRAARVTRSHTIRLNAPADDVFPLFGPVRESEWEPQWRPEFVAGTCGDGPSGQVFRHEAGEEFGMSTWYVADWDPANRKVRYVSFTPLRDVRVVRVEVSPVSADICAAAVSYEFTGLTDEGNGAIGEMTEGRFAGWIDEWAQAINRLLGNGA